MMIPASPSLTHSLTHDCLPVCLGNLLPRCGVLLAGWISGSRRAGSSSCSSQRPVDGGRQRGRSVRQAR